MYSIRDFHSSEAPPLRPPPEHFLFQPDGEADDEPTDAELAFDYTRHFFVLVGTDKVVIDNVCEQVPNAEILCS